MAIMNFKDEILEQADGEAINAIVVGEFGWGPEPDDSAYGFLSSERRRPIPKKLKFIPVKWEEVADYLDYNYDRDYGGPDCHKIYAWTNSWIIYVDEYDGATQVSRIPRHPVPCEPDFGG
jgi:hypothetical protein